MSDDEREALARLIVAHAESQNRRLDDLAKAQEARLTAFDKAQEARFKSFQSKQDIAIELFHNCRKHCDEAMPKVYDRVNAIKEEQDTKISKIAKCQKYAQGKADAEGERKSLIAHVLPYWGYVAVGIASLLLGLIIRGGLH